MSLEKIVLVFIIFVYCVNSSSHNIRIVEKNKPVRFFGTKIYTIVGKTDNFFVSKISVVFPNEVDGTPLISFKQNGRKTYHPNFLNHYIAKVTNKKVLLAHIDHHLDGAKLRVEITNSLNNQKSLIDSQPINLIYKLGKKKNLRSRTGFYIKGKAAEIHNGQIVIQVDSSKCKGKAKCQLGFCDELQENCLMNNIPQIPSTFVVSGMTIQISEESITIGGDLSDNLGRTVIISFNGRITSSQPISFGDRFVRTSKKGKEINYEMKTPGDITNYALTLYSKEQDSPKFLCFCNVQGETPCNIVDTTTTEECTRSKLKFKSKVKGIVMVSVVNSTTKRERDALYYIERRGIAGILR